MEQLFLDARVQSLLRGLIGVDPTMVYADRMMASTERAHYAMMTDRMIEEVV
jgi:hypothetical protein